MTEQLFDALKAIETLTSGAMEVNGLPSGQGLDRRNDMALTCDMDHIVPTVQALALRQSINLHNALSLIYYCLVSGWPTPTYKNETRQPQELTWNKWEVMYWFSLLMPSPKLKIDVFQNKDCLVG